MNITDEQLKEGFDAIFKSISKRERKPFEFEEEIINNPKETLTVFFKEIICKYEGSCCCTDKARFIAGGIIKTLENGNVLSLQQTYGKELCDKHGWSYDEIAYWCPLMFDDTKQAIDLYINYICLDLVNFQKLLDEALIRLKNKINDKKEG